MVLSCVFQIFKYNFVNAEVSGVKESVAVIGFFMANNMRNMGMQYAYKYKDFILTLMYILQRCILLLMILCKLIQQIQSAFS